MDTSVKFTAIISVAIVAVAVGILVYMILPNQTIQASHQSYIGQKKEFWLFNSDIPEFNETKMGMPHDSYSMQTITVFKGDTVVIHFFNTEGPGGDNHTFTINDKPYSINVELVPGENKTFSFEANASGIFNYYCTVHPPTMRGQLVVLEPPTP